MVHLENIGQLMQVNQDSNQAKYRIQSYNTDGDDKGVTINGTLYRHSILIHGNELSQWRPSSFEDLQPKDFETLLQCPVPILLLGTGKTVKIPSTDLLHPLFQRGIGVEFMSTQAAIRTYSILTSENREVSLALIMI